MLPSSSFGKNAVHLTIGGQRDELHLSLSVPAVTAINGTVELTIFNQTSGDQTLTAVDDKGRVFFSDETIPNQGPTLKQFQHLQPHTKVILKTNAHRGPVTADFRVMPA